MDLNLNKLTIKNISCLGLLLFSITIYFILDHHEQHQKNLCTQLAIKLSHLQKSIHFAAPEHHDLKQDVDALTKQTTSLINLIHLLLMQDAFDLVFHAVNDEERTITIKGLARSSATLEDFVKKLSALLANPVVIQSIVQTPHGDLNFELSTNHAKADS